MEKLSRHIQQKSIQLTLWSLTLGSPAWLQTKPHFGADGAVLRPSVGTGDRLCHQHDQLVSPPDEVLIQQAPVSRPGVHPGRLLSLHEVREGIGQDQVVFRTGSQKKEAVIVTTTKTVGTQHSLLGSVVCPDAGVEAIFGTVARRACRSS
ncbi:unnamed protein product [Schistocephalus solidus]|uniref:Secreted protein n=1 Tax=Schistocephalus solidus TaxID=70667 RepID=A0A183T2B8_SCHSO|nr:unnamed protein product [Schistocephalus solidus]